MPRAGDRISPARLRTLVAPGTYADGRGLYLRIRSPDARSWAFRYMIHGKAHWLGLGSADAVTLAEARQKALEARRAIAAGTDPLASRRAMKEAAKSAAARSFQAVAQAYIEAHRDGWKNETHRAQWPSTLEKYVYPKIGTIPVAEIEVGHVMDVLHPIWRQVPETASRVRGRIESVLDFAAARGWRKGDNPARWRGHLETLLPARAKLARVEHHAALPWREVGTFMTGLAAQEGVSALALRFLILTASRTNEVLAATWGEIDRTNRLWTIPAGRMKAGREHWVPLSDASLAILDAVAPPGTGRAPEAFVFPGAKPGRGLSNMAFLMLLRRIGRGELTGHGFRSTFRDWAGESTAYPREVIEHALAHQLKDKAEAAYARGTLLEKRRALMQDWGRVCGRAAVAGEVVAILAGAKAHRTA